MKKRAKKKSAKRNLRNGSLVVLGVLFVFTLIVIGSVIFSDKVRLSPGDEFHSADTNEDWVISTDERTRVQDLWVGGEFYCDSSTEDGYAIGSGDRTCDPHDSDYAVQDWQLDATNEYPRIVSLFDAGKYHINSDNPDGFGLGDCSSGDEKCDGTTYFSCSVSVHDTDANYEPSVVEFIGAWKNEGKVYGKCGITEEDFHSADTNHDWVISDGEHNRVQDLWVESYSVGYHCDSSTVDGYAAGNTDRTCDRHDIDYNPQNWDVDTNEYARSRSLYDAGSYHINPDNPDGFGLGDCSSGDEKCDGTTYFSCRINIHDTKANYDPPVVEFIGAWENKGEINGKCGLENPHSADTDGDWVISSEEYNRVQTLWIAEDYHCDSSTEDGYAIGLGDQTCDRHDIDYLLPYWEIGTGPGANEYARARSLFDAGSYHINPDNLDGFGLGDCSSGDEKCDGTNYFSCSISVHDTEAKYTPDIVEYIGAWVNQGQVNGKCGYSGDGGGDGDGDGDECDTDSDCEEGEICDDGECVDEGCTGDVVSDCADGSTIIVYECVNGELIATENQCPYGGECINDVMEDCADGSTIVTYECVGGELIATGNDCEEPEETNWGVVIAIIVGVVVVLIILVVILFVILSKGKSLSPTSVIKKPGTSPTTKVKNLK